MVENVPYFIYPRAERRIGEKIRELWRDGKRDDSAKLLADLTDCRRLDPGKAWERLEAASAVASLTYSKSKMARGGRMSGSARICEEPEHRSRRAQRRRRKSVGRIVRSRLPEWAFSIAYRVQVDRRTRAIQTFRRISARSCFSAWSATATARSIGKVCLSLSAGGRARREELEPRSAGHDPRTRR